MSNPQRNRPRLESYPLPLQLEVKPPKPGFFSGLFRRIAGPSPLQSAGNIPETVASQSETSGSETADVHDQSSDDAHSEVSSLPAQSAIGFGWRTPSSQVANPMHLLRRISSIRTTGINKEYWMKDEKVKECYDCKQSFSAFRRRHHCRICGQIFCTKCASSIVNGVRFGHDSDMRVCNFCLQLIDEYRPESPSFDIYSAGSETGIRTKARIRSASISFPIDQTLDRPMARHTSTVPFKHPEGHISPKMPRPSSAPFRKAVKEGKTLDKEQESGQYATTDDELGNSKDAWQPSPFLEILPSPSLPRFSSLHFADPDKNSSRRGSIKDSRRSISTAGRKLITKIYSSRSIPVPIDSSKTTPLHAQITHVSDELPNNVLNTASVRHLSLLLHQVRIMINQGAGTVRD